MLNLFRKKIDKLKLSKKQTEVLRDVIDFNREGDYKDTMDEITKMDYLMERNEAHGSQRPGPEDIPLQ
jgi:hypothetical protein